jgi:hypothetical protein
MATVELVAVRTVAPSCWKNPHLFSSLPILKNCARVRPLYPSEVTVCGNRRGLIVLVALRAHHTPTCRTQSTPYSILSHSEHTILQLVALRTHHTPSCRTQSTPYSILSHSEHITLHLVALRAHHTPSCRTQSTPHSILSHSEHTTLQRKSPPCVVVRAYQLTGQCLLFWAFCVCFLYRFPQ